jgi:hypothetical protein
MPLGPHAVLWALVYHADKDGCCHPGSELLAFEAASSTPRAVRNWMAELEEAGWVKVERGTGRGNPSKYRLLIPQKEEARSSFPSASAPTSPPPLIINEEPRSPFVDPSEEQPPRKGEQSSRKGEQSSLKGEHYSKPPTPPLEEEQPKNSPGTTASCTTRDPQPHQGPGSLSLGGGEPPPPPSSPQQSAKAREEAPPRDPAHSAGTRPAPQPQVNGAVVGVGSELVSDPAPTSPPSQAHPPASELGLAPELGPTPELGLAAEPSPTSEPEPSSIFEREPGSIPEAPQAPAATPALRAPTPSNKPSPQERLDALLGTFGHSSPFGRPTLPPIPAPVPGRSARPHKPNHTNRKTR